MHTVEFGGITAHILNPEENNTRRAVDIAHVFLEAYANAPRIRGVTRGDIMRGLDCNPESEDHTRATLKSIANRRHHWGVALLDALPTDVRAEKFPGSPLDRVVACTVFGSGDDAVRVLELHTHPGAQRHGLATALMWAGLGAAIAARKDAYTNATPVSLNVIPARPDAPGDDPAAFYSSLSFEYTGEEDPKTTMLGLNTRPMATTVGKLMGRLAARGAK